MDQTRTAAAFASKSSYNIFFFSYLGISPFSFSCSLYKMFVQILLGVVLLITYYKAIECNFFRWPSLIHRNSKLQHRLLSCMCQMVSLRIHCGGFLRTILQIKNIGPATQLLQISSATKQIVQTQFALDAI